MKDRIHRGSYRIWIMRFLEQRIGGRRTLRLIRKWLTVGVAEDGRPNAAARLIETWLPRPRIQHPWPQARFRVKHPRWEPDALIGPVRFLCGGRSAMSVPAAI
jgi:hypothetical protein